MGLNTFGEAVFSRLPGRLRGDRRRLDDDSRHVVELRAGAAESADGGVQGIDDRSGGLVLVGAAFGLFGIMESLHINDVFGNRMNTLFKFYYQIWILWGLAAGYGLWRALYIVHGALSEGRETGIML